MSGFQGKNTCIPESMRFMLSQSRYLFLTQLAEVDEAEEGLEISVVEEECRVAETQPVETVVEVVVEAGMTQEVMAAEEVGADLVKAEAGDEIFTEAVVVVMGQAGEAKVEEELAGAVVVDQILTWAPCELFPHWIEHLACRTTKLSP